MEITHEKEAPIDFDVVEGAAAPDGLKAKLDDDDDDDDEDEDFQDCEEEVVAPTTPEAQSSSTNNNSDDVLFNESLRYADIEMGVPEQEAEDADMMHGLQLFYNNDFIAARNHFRCKSRDNPIFLLGLGAIAFLVR